ncbi:hypothetical protein K8Z61_14540 [Nocardioides sp. TRM66260-LWL]|uniref:hypothetical protein n=1 Tax=Nocardioides sp. TRM66260-LWL TaxID=2874478 RepID=UPI001CC3659D|nr:hypothetical protein [Nocardioides sp. TRM66260-LWL]MBZ5735709.1 hypothetical protein [Nocardioides sp. TRM66260-LWL]
MSRTVRTPTSRGDRTMLTVLALVLLAVGALLVDAGTGNRLGLLTVPASISKDRADSVLDASWFDGVLLGGGIVLGLLALIGLLRPRRRVGGRLVRLSASTERGRVELDVTALAQAVAEQVARLEPFDTADGLVRQHGGRHLVEVRARLNAEADAAEVQPLLAGVRDDLAEAVPAQSIALRVVVESPRAPSRRDRSRAQESVRIRPDTIPA